MSLGQIILSCNYGKHITHARMHAHTHTRTHAHTHTYTHTRTHSHTHIRPHAHTNIHTRTHAHTHTCTHAHTHTRTHAHTHTLARTPTHRRRRPGCRCSMGRCAPNHDEVNAPFSPVPLAMNGRSVFHSNKQSRMRRGIRDSSGCFSRIKNSRPKRDANS